MTKVNIKTKFSTGDLIYLVGKKLQTATQPDIAYGQEGLFLLLWFITST